MDYEEFEKLLKICRIELNSEEKEKIKNEIEEVINDYFNKIDRIECNEEPAYHPIDIKGKLREDIPSEFENNKGILENTKTYRGYVISPKV